MSIKRFTFSCDCCQRPFIDSDTYPYYHSCECSLVCCSKCVQSRGKDRKRGCHICKTNETCQLVHKCENDGCRRYAYGHHMNLIDRFFCKRCELICFQLRQPLKEMINKRQKYTSNVSSN